MYDLLSQGHHSQIFMTGGGGGVRQRFIFYTQKNHNFRICLPKKITTFLGTTQKNLLVPFPQSKKIPLFFFFATQKNPSVFHRPKKITTFLGTTQKNLLDPFPQPKKIPLFFFYVTQKNPSVFHRPKKITLAKISDPKKSLRPSRHYVSRAPGSFLFQVFPHLCKEATIYMSSSNFFKV